MGPVEMGPVEKVVTNGVFWLMAAVTMVIDLPLMLCSRSSTGHLQGCRYWRGSWMACHRLHWHPGRHHCLDCTPSVRRHTAGSATAGAKCRVCSSCWTCLAGPCQADPQPTVQELAGPACLLCQWLSQQQAGRQVPSFPWLRRPMIGRQVAEQAC